MACRSHPWPFPRSVRKSRPFNFQSILHKAFFILVPPKCLRSNSQFQQHRSQCSSTPVVLHPFAFTNRNDIPAPVPFSPLQLGSLRFFSILPGPTLVKAPLFPCPLLFATSIIFHEAPNLPCNFPSS